MKKIINKIFNQKKFMFIFGTVFGLIVATGISYGVNQIQSSSVSYTKSDGTTVSVKQALDDLINKSLTRIEFLEKWLSSNTGLSLEQIKNKNEFDYLADVVKVGDYVAYDAGSWTETKAKPTSQGQFGGYTSGQNKANSSNCSDRGGSTTLKGWRVYSIDTSTKTVTLVHASIPECYYHAYGQSGASVTNLNNRANTYLNSNYADSAHNMTKAEADQNILRTTGVYYWLATVGGGDFGYDIYVVGDDGRTFTANGWSHGVRPVVVLKSNILTTGKGIDAVGQEAWTLVKP